MSQEQEQLCAKLLSLYNKCEVRNQKDAGQVCEDERNAYFACLNHLSESKANIENIIQTRAKNTLFTKQQEHTQTLEQQSLVYTDYAEVEFMNDEQLEKLRHAFKKQ